MYPSTMSERWSADDMISRRRLRIKSGGFPKVSRSAPSEFSAARAKAARVMRWQALFDILKVQREAADGGARRSFLLYLPFVSRWRKVLACRAADAIWVLHSRM